MLLVQHAATITRNRLGLTPRDYAREREVHDTLKVRVRVRVGVRVGVRVRPTTRSRRGPNLPR